LKVTANNDCGVIALFDIAYHATGSRTLTKDIAVRQGLSEKHIRQILQKLKRARLVKSVRGYAGGYSLGKPVGEISVGDVIRALDGPIQFVGCVRDGAKSRGYCE
jgi:Rrf2 family protein